MPNEIERKFLVIPERWHSLEKPQPQLLHQGYLLNTKQKTIRVRQTNTQGFITIKGPTQGITRHEFEYEIPWQEAGELLVQFCDVSIKKNRYKIQHQQHGWDVDCFLDANNGLIVAEIELSSETEPFEKPDWLGEEVSHDPRYYNANLINHPFSEWGQ